MTDTSRFLFVYGTLRRDPAHQVASLLASKARFVGAASVPGQLFDLGDYPGMISKEGAAVVHGEVYEVGRDRWRDLITTLDRYEGCAPEDPEPHEYSRRLVEARLQTGQRLNVWAYLLNTPVAGLPEIKSGDYLDWVATRRA
jgi:gamma-glutamylcyclotransferase (GGCT)/AIG2-like uncharacterized protein YtfP